jgi:hypothetical protein
MNRAQRRAETRRTGKSDTKAGHRERLEQARLAQLVTTIWGVDWKLYHEVFGPPRAPWKLDRAINGRPVYECVGIYVSPALDIVVDRFGEPNHQMLTVAVSLGEKKTLPSDEDMEVVREAFVGFEVDRILTWKPDRMRSLKRRMPLDVKKVGDASQGPPRILIKPAEHAVGAASVDASEPDENRVRGRIDLTEENPK